jgi:hypothetical protein
VLGSPYRLELVDFDLGVSENVRRVRGIFLEAVRASLPHFIDDISDGRGLHLATRAVGKATTIGWELITISVAVADSTSPVITNSQESFVSSAA